MLGHAIFLTTAESQEPWGKPQWADHHLTLWGLCSVSTGRSQVQGFWWLLGHGLLLLGLWFSYSLVWATGGYESALGGTDWDSTVAHVSHVPCATDRPCPENGDEAQGFLFWHAPELCCLIWLHPVLTVPKPVCFVEWRIAETQHALSAKGVVPGQPMPRLSGFWVSLLCQECGRNDWDSSQDSMQLTCHFILLLLLTQCFNIYFHWFFLFVFLLFVWLHWVLVASCEILVEACRI